MKFALVCFCCILLTVCVFGINGQGYEGRYDNVDVDTLLKNDRVIDNYVKCLLDKGPCTKEGRLLKEDIPDAIESNCTKCSEKQKNIVRKASRALRDRRPDQWTTLLNKYDPKGERVGEFEKFLNGE